MFAAVHIPQFALQSALRPTPELQQSAVVLVDPAATTPRVIDLTAPATALGATVGLTPTQALARCRELVVRHRSMSQEASTTEAALQIAHGFSPNIENSAPGLITLDLRGLTDATDTGTAPAWAARLRTAIERLSVRARVGIAPNPGVARHAARWTDSEQVVTDASAFIRNLPVAALEPSEHVVMVLQKWGIRTVGELLALGQAELAERFGLEALGLFAAASATATRPLHLHRPAAEFRESFDLEESVESLEPLLFILRRFIDQIAGRLELAGLAAERLTLRLRLESGEILERHLRVPQPTRQADVLFRMLHTHLESVRTASPVSSVSLVAAPTRPEQKQFSLFDAALRDPFQFQETIARLEALLGPGRVGTPVKEDSHHPDAFRMLPPDFDSTPESAGQRPPVLLDPLPLRRLRPPVPAEVNCSATAPTGIPSDLRTSRPIELRCAWANGRLITVSGPWRSSGHWWGKDTWSRDEWDATPAKGPTVRLVHRDGQWTVEGLVD